MTETNIDTTKARKLGCTSTCTVAFQPSYEGDRSRPCTPPQNGLCVVYLLSHDERAKNGVLKPVYVLRVTHVASGLALLTEFGCYPATAPGMRAAKRELAALLPLRDWAQPAEVFRTECMVDVEVVVRRCRAEFGGKLIRADKAATRRTASGAAFAVIPWRVHTQADDDTWTVQDFAEIDSVAAALETLETVDAKPLEGPAPALHDATPWGINGALAVHELPRDGERRVLVCLPVAAELAFEAALDSLIAASKRFTAALFELHELPNPRVVFGVKSGPRKGQLALPSDMSPERAEQLHAQQRERDAKDLALSDLSAYVATLRGAVDDYHERVFPLRPTTRPDGETEAAALLAKVEAASEAVGLSSLSKLPTCAKQLERQLLEYASVREHGFAPGTRCEWGPDDEPGTWHACTIEDVHVTHNVAWFDGPTHTHSRDIVDEATGGQWTVPITALRKLRA